MTKLIFNNLDVLRTILALTVALGHFYYWNQVTTIFPRSFFIAVDLFFVLSGFVLTHSILNSSTHTFESFIKSFALKRINRLFPLYWILFLLTLVLLYISNSLTDTFFHYFTSTFLLQGVGFDKGGEKIFADTTIGIAWSLSVEFWVGLLFFPFVFWLKNKFVTLFYCCSLISLISSAVLFNIFPSIDLNFQKLYSFITVGSIRGLIGFACGTNAYIIYKILNRKQFHQGLLSLFEFMLLGIIIKVLYLPHNIANEYIAPYLFSTLLPLLAKNTGLLGNILSSPIFKIFRHPSYTIYLIHPFLIFIWRYYHLKFTLLSAIVYVLLVLIISLLTYKFIESPLLKKGKLLIKEIN